MEKLKAYIPHLDDKPKHILFILVELLLQESSGIEDFYERVYTIEDSEIVIIPYSINYYYNVKKTKELFTVLEKAEACTKIVLCYTSGDFGISIKKSYKHCFTFRNAGYKSKATKRDLIIPVFVDPLTKVLDKKNIRVLKKQERPIIGFVGQATNNIFKRFKDISYTLILNCARSLKLIYNDKQSIFPAVYNRYQLIKSLEANKEIETKFILYQKYRAGSKTVEDKKRSTFTFLNNMIESNYIFCVRGTGNFSVRFYEALAMGRIPVLFNTDSMLPLKDEISWNDHILIIDKHDDIAEKLINFHKNVSSEAFENIQKKNRDLSVSHLSIINYFKIIYQLIRTKKAPFN